VTSVGEWPAAAGEGCLAWPCRALLAPGPSLTSSRPCPPGHVHQQQPMAACWWQRWGAALAAEEGSDGAIGEGGGAGVAAREEEAWDREDR
jgi:hypothetical protein